MNRLEFFSTQGQSVLGLSSNGLLSLISLATGAILIAAGIRGGRTASTVTVGVGAAFLLSGVGNVLVLTTELNVLAFTMANVIFSLLAGFLLLTLGAWGRFAGRLPSTAMICPRWVRTRTQPIAVADVIRYLVGVLDHSEAAGRRFDIGGDEVLAYIDMMRRVAAIEGRTMLVVPVPLLSPRLSSRWLSLVTDVDVQTGRALIDSMSNEVVVRDDGIRALVPFTPTPYDDAVLTALGERAASGRALAAGGSRRTRRP